MAKEIKLFGLPKFGSLRGSTSASLKVSEILAICKKWQVFETRGRTYFALHVDRVISYTNKLGSRALGRLHLVAGRISLHCLSILL